MQPTHSDHHADADLDAQLRAALDPGDDLEFARERSHYGTAFDLDDAIAAEVAASRPRRRAPRPRRSWLAVAGGLAVALLVAGALAPGFSDDPGLRHGSSPFAAADASAAEVLERAAQRMLAGEGAVGGSGPAWHSIVRTDDGGAFEAWFDSDRGVARWAIYQPETTGISDPNSSLSAFPASYYVLDSDAAGNGTIRQYDRSGSGAWKPLPGGSQMNSNGQVDGISGSRLEVEALAWLRAADAASDASDLHAANERFVERTHMWFAPPSENGAPGEAEAMQLLYLLRVAQLEPAAVAQLYRDVIDIADLERLPDGRIDGRAVLRLRLFDPPKDLGGGQLASVLLLDAETGVPIGMEATNGSKRELFETPTRTSRVGADAVSCGAGPKPPCALLRGEGEIAASADRIAGKFSQPLDPTPGSNGTTDEVVGAPTSVDVAPAPNAR